MIFELLVEWKLSLESKRARLLVVWFQDKYFIISKTVCKTFT